MKMTMPELHISRTPEEAAQSAGSFVAALAEECVADHGRFTIALSGGSTPRQLYRVLASPPHAKEVAWDSWHVFWGDERCVPPDHEDSNYRMASEVLLDHVPIPPDHVHRMRGEIAPQKADDEYESVLREVFQTGLGETNPIGRSTQSWFVRTPSGYDLPVRKYEVLA